jgi:hypothetical protein
MSLKVEKGYDYTAGYLLDAGIDSLDPLEISRLKKSISDLKRAMLTLSRACT